MPPYFSAHLKKKCAEHKSVRKTPQNIIKRKVINRIVLSPQKLELLCRNFMMSILKEPMDKVGKMQECLGILVKGHFLNDHM